MRWGGGVNVTTGRRETIPSTPNEWNVVVMNTIISPAVQLHSRVPRGVVQEGTPPSISVQSHQESICLYGMWPEGICVQYPMACQPLQQVWPQQLQSFFLVL